MQTPAREAIQQDAERATFERRALAVEKEAAIGENELANQVELPQDSPARRIASRTTMSGKRWPGPTPPSPARVSS